MVGRGRGKVSQTMMSQTMMSRILAIVEREKIESEKKC